MSRICAILGTGPSLQHFDPAGYSFAIGANDTYMFAPCDAICVTDKPKDIKRKRPGFFLTPENVEKFFIKGSRWEKWAEENANAKIITTKRVPFGNRGRRDREGMERLFSRIPLTPKGGLWHGYHTPFFASQVAIGKGYTSLHYFGIDGGCFSGDQRQLIVDELNFLHYYLQREGGGVSLCRHSELWGFDKDLFRKLEIGEV